MVDPSVEKPPEAKKAYCKKCLSVGRLSILKERLYMDLKPNEPKPSDHEKFRQCHVCMEIYPIYLVKIEGKMVAAVGSVPLSPFDRDQNYVISVGDTRPHTQAERQRQQIKKWRQEEIDKIKDPDAKMLARSGKRLISYTDSMEDKY